MRKLKSGFLACAAVMVVLGAASPLQAEEADAKSTSLESALLQYAKANNLQLLFSPERVRDKTVAGVNDRLPPNEALPVLLAGTDLQAVAKGNRTYSIVASNEAGGEAVETVVVTGYNAATHAAIAAKQKSQVIIDTIGTDDIGQLPDLNIVESARRIVGLSTVGGLDPSTNRDIYQRVTIRGLDPKYNLITVDGVPLASSEWTVRGARLEQFPNSLVSRIEAIKTVTAEYDPQGLGGQINIVTRSAFNARNDTFFALNGNIGLNSSSGDFLRGREPSLKFDGTGSLVFGSRNQFGFTLSAEYQHLLSSAQSELPGDTDGTGWSYYSASGATTPFIDRSSNGAFVPVRIQDYHFDNQRTRSSINGKFEYAISPKATLSLFGGFFVDKDQEFRAEMLLLPGGAPAPYALTAGTVATGELQQGIVLQPQTRETYLTTAKGDFSLSEDLHLDVTGSFSRATFKEERVFQKWATHTSAGKRAESYSADVAYSYVIQDGVPRITFKNQDLLTDPDTYQLYYIRDIWLRSNSNVAFANAKLSYRDGENDRGFGMRAGLAYTQSKVNFDQSYNELVAANNASLSQIGGLSDYIYGRSFKARESYSIPFMVIDPAKVLDYVAANPAQFFATDHTADNYQSDFNDIESIAGAYLQGMYRSNDWYVVAGVRYDQTDLSASTFQAVADKSGKVSYLPFYRKAEYNFLLPSVLATYHLNDEMRLTAGFSETVGRPDYAQYAASTSYSVTSAGGLTINTGNVGLKPRKSLNYDLSYEWYRPDGGIVSAALFYKDISNEIFTGSQVGPATTYQGTTYTDVTITEPLNAAKAQIKGVELSYTRSHFDYLPSALDGFGINTNLTLMQGSFQMRNSAAAVADGARRTRDTTGLLQQPDYILNFTAFYDLDAFEARVSYNRIGNALQSADQDTPDRDLYERPRNQIDFQLRYRVFDNMDLLLQGQNITGEPFIVKQGQGHAYVGNHFSVGSTIWMGFSLKN